MITNKYKKYEKVIKLLQKLKRPFDVFSYWSASQSPINLKAVSIAKKSDVKYYLLFSIDVKPKKNKYKSTIYGENFVIVMTTAKNL